MIINYIWVGTCIYNIRKIISYEYLPRFDLGGALFSLFKSSPVKLKTLVPGRRHCALAGNNR